MSRDVNTFYGELGNNFSTQSSNLAGVIIAVSFLECISIIFLLIVIFKYTGLDKDRESIKIVPEK